RIRRGSRRLLQEPPGGLQAAAALPVSRGAAAQRERQGAKERAEARIRAGRGVRERKLSAGRTLPAGVADADFGRALAAFGDAVGAAHVLSDPAQLLPYGRIMLPVPDEEHQPSAVVMAASVEEIQKVL